MSFSFSINAKSKTEAARRVAEEMANIVHVQQAHALDIRLVLQTVQLYLDAVGSPLSGNWNVLVNGSVGWHYGEDGVTPLVSSLSIGVNVGTS